MAKLDYKPFRFFGTQASYDAKRSSGDIDDRTVCLIKDTGKIMHDDVSYGGGDDLAMPVLREGESSNALWEQLATIAGSDVESVAVQYITADGMMWRGTWYPTQGYLDVHTISGVYRLEFEDVVGGLSDATFIATVTADSVNVGSKSQSSLNVTLDGKALIEISLTSSGSALAFTGSLPAGSSTKIVIKNTSSSSRSFNFSTTSSITSLLSSTSVTVPAYKAVVLEILSNGSSMVLYQLA